MKHRWTSALGVGVCAAFALVGCGTNAPAGSSTSTSACNGSAEVNGLGAIASTIDATDNLVFVPATLATQVGDVVEFKNAGSMQHTVTFQDPDDQCLTDATLDPGATWEVKFSAPGTYHYLCTIHAPNMKGEISVTGS